MGEFLAVALPIKCARSVTLVVAESTVETSFLFAMAIHAAAHGEVGLARELRARCHRAVTLCAGIAGLDMRAVAEVDEAGDFINPHPLELAIVLSGMATATHRWLRKSHGLAGIGIRMAGCAFQLQIACV